MADATGADAGVEAARLTQELDDDGLTDLAIKPADNIGNGVVVPVATPGAVVVSPIRRKRPREDSSSPIEEAQKWKAFCSFQIKEASRRREDLVIQWREVSRPRRAGAVAAKPPGARLDFAPLFQEWLEARDLAHLLEREEDEAGWAVFKYNRPPVVAVNDATWEIAYHGTWWYAVWLILDSGVLLESNNRERGHDFWEPGVYCSPVLDTARWYARPQILFGDGVYHRIIFELRVDPAQRKRNRQRGGVQWVFPSAAVSLHRVKVQINCPPKNGEERVREWDAALEALPPGRTQVAPTVNKREGPWPDVEPEEGWDAEDYPLPPHLAGSNPSPKPIRQLGANPLPNQPIRQLPAIVPSYFSRLRQARSLGVQASSIFVQAPCIRPSMRRPLVPAFVPGGPECWEDDEDPPLEMCDGLMPPSWYGMPKGGLAMGGPPGWQSLQGKGPLAPGRLIRCGYKRPWEPGALLHRTGIIEPIQPAAKFVGTVPRGSVGRPQVLLQSAECLEEDGEADWFNPEGNMKVQCSQPDGDLEEEDMQAFADAFAEEGEHID